MKNILILLTVLLLPLAADGQDKPSFSAREMADVRVATPGLFAKGNHIYLHLDSLKDHEYAFPLPGGKSLPMELAEDIREQTLRPVQKIRFVLLLMEWCVCRNPIMPTEISL